MDSFLKMDVFFLVTTVSVAVLGVLLGIALIELIRILRNVEHTSKNISEASDSIRDDVSRFRNTLRATAVGAFLGRMFGKRTNRKRDKVE